MAAQADKRYAISAMFIFEERDGIPVLRAEGDVDVMNVKEFDEALRQLAESVVRIGVITLEDATFVSVHAFGIISARIAHAHSQGRHLVLVCPDGSFHRKVLRLLRFPHEVASSIEQAVSPLRRPEEAIAKT